MMLGKHLRSACDAADRIGRYNSNVHDMVGRVDDVIKTLDARRRERIAVFAEDALSLLVESREVYAPLLAAVAWTLGDVAHAKCIAFHQYTPPLAYIKALVRTSLVRVREDPLISEVWLGYRQALSAAVRARNDQILLELRFRYAFGPKVFDDDQQPGHVYGAAAVSFFRLWMSGEAAKAIDEVYAKLLIEPAWRPEGGRRTASDALTIQILSMCMLCISGTQGWNPENWEELLRRGGLIVEHHSGLGTLNRHNRATDLPSWYLASYADGGLESLERSLQLVEDYRESGIRYWLRAVGPIVDRPSHRCGEIQRASRSRKQLGPFTPRHPVRVARRKVPAAYRQFDRLQMPSDPFPVKRGYPSGKDLEAAYDKYVHELMRVFTAICWSTPPGTR